jgi:multidrug efflux system membrane fusion protein
MLTIVVAGALAALVLAGCSKPDAAAAGPAMRGDPAAPVVVAQVVEQDTPVQIRSIARVEPSATVTVKPQVAGQIVAVHFKEGQDVNKGDLLFSLDARPFEATLSQMEGMLARDTTLWEDAEREAKRQSDLHDQGVAAQREYETAIATASSLRGTVQADQAGVERAQLDVEYCAVRSPLAGRTGERLADPGNVVKANEAVLVVVNQINPIYVSFSVPEARLADVRKSQAEGPLKVEAILPNEEADPEFGQLTFIDNQVDRQTGMITLRGTFANERRRLWPGQFVNAVLTLRTLPRAIVVPTAALQTGQTGSFVYVVKEDRTVEMRPVSPGLVIADQTVIDHGLSAGETVVLEGQLRLVAGSKVSIKNQPSTRPSAQESGA